MNLPSSSRSHFLFLALTVLSLGSFLPDTQGSGVVTNCTEASLRAALAGGGSVTFDCDGVIYLTNSLVIAQTTMIDAGEHQITLHGNSAVRVLKVEPGITVSLIG